MAKNIKVVAAQTVTPAQVREWWPADRAKVIVKLMADGLEYWRAVRRSRRYYLEGKY